MKLETINFQMIFLAKNLLEQFLHTVLYDIL